MPFSTVALVAVAAFILCVTIYSLVLCIINYLALPFGRFPYYGSAHGSRLVVIVPEASSKAASVCNTRPRLSVVMPD
jgi:hypothetical protein